MSKKINVAAIMRQVDEYYAKNRGFDAEKLMQDTILEAASIGDEGSLLQLLNELLGYYRETSRVKDSYAIARQCMDLAVRMGLEGSIPYATTLLNVANAYRAGGRLKDSLQLYLKVREIYDVKLSKDDMLIASMENNLSLLYQELGEFAEAKESLLRALRIVETKTGVEFEIAVTYANLATSCLNIREIEEAYSYAKASIQAFDALGIEDAHYGAVLSALATYHYQKREYRNAQELFEKAMHIMERNLGRNEFYDRLKENAQVCRAAQEMNESKAQDSMPQVSDEETVSGMALSRAFYEECGAPMIAEKFPDYEDKIAVGLVGIGSDCFGYDDADSTDHDWGPEFCMWVTQDTYAAIGEKLEAAYEELPEEFQGYKRMPKNVAKERRGLFIIQDFFEELIGYPGYEEVNWREVPDYALASVTNGEVFRDDEGIFSALRSKFLNGYPEEIHYLKMADSAARFSQAGQYNYNRMLKRGDKVTAQIMMADAAREAMKLQHYIDGVYPPHDKWLYRSVSETEDGRTLAGLVAGLPDTVEQIGEFLANELYINNYISDSDNYLDSHSDELSRKAVFATYSNERLVEQIIKAEFKAFDKVQNVGGRASCQNDWPTFSIMRKSQYMTWNRTMLLQYLYDFIREISLGHNLIEEKYGRMMESTAPEEYEAIKEHFPVINPDKKNIIEQIVQFQVSWMEDFAKKYPTLAENARSIHTGDDSIANTSYETYLRGEISTYSDKMLELYGRYIVEYAHNGKNLAFDIMTNSVHLYGYTDLDSAERLTKQQFQRDLNNSDLNNLDFEIFKTIS